ncbi:MAG: hypothetical protein ACTSX1_02815 [Candidatus Heimdallarchaeaceae archaeon]
MISLKLKIKEKGLMIEIPGIAPMRTPVDIDISNIDINLVIAVLRRSGINNYNIVSVTEDGVEKTVSVPQELKKKVKEKYPSDPSVDKRFDRLESMMINLLNRNFESKTDLSQEQITNKLDRLEKITQSIANGQKHTVVHTNKSDDPVIEEMDTMFIPDIDLDGMSLKGSSLKTIETNEGDLDEAADLLSSITRKEK